MGNIVGMGDRKAVRREADYIATSLKAAASVISQGMLVLDSDLRILFMNAKYREFFDLRDQEAADQEGAYFPDHLLYLAARGNYPEGMSDDQIRGRLGPIFERADYVRDRQLKDGRHVRVIGTPLGTGGYSFTYTDITDQVQERERLDRLVQSRTEALHSANRKLVDGIEYARLIQTGILPQPTFFEENLGPHFIHFQPSDIVGGDFYLGLKTEYGLYIGLGDCTGHGVPGAMMTMMAASVCRRAIGETGIGGPATVMMAVDRAVRTNLHQSEARVGPDNGLEMTLCLIEPDLGRIRIAGAGLDFFVQTDGAIERVKASKHGLGYGRQTSSATTITEAVFTDKEVERIFLTSDGALDQSGGEKGFGFGRRRLMEALSAGAGQSIEEQGQGLVAAIEDYSTGHHQRDDLAILGFSTRRSGKVGR